MLSFGLIYKDQLPELGLSATDVSVIMNTFSAFGMSFGLINGPLIKNYGYRKVGVASGVFFSLGMFLTAWANNFTHFMITYSIIAGMEFSQHLLLDNILLISNISATGMGMATSSFSFAVNSFFRKRRNRAVGIGATLTGLGPVVVPQLTSVLLEKYGSKGCVLILSAISLHVIAAGLLLQPIKWHLVSATPTIAAKETVIEVEMQPIATVIKEEDEDERGRDDDVFDEEDHRYDQTMLPKIDERSTNNGFSDFSSEDEADYLDLNIRRLSIEHEIETQSIYGPEITPGISIMRLNSINDQSLTIFQSKQDLTFNRPSDLSQTHRNLRYRRQSSALSSRSHAPAYMRSLSLLATQQQPKRWFETSGETINLGSSMNIFNEKTTDERKVMIKEPRTPEKYSAFPAGSVKVTEEANKIMEKSTKGFPQKSAMRKSTSTTQCADKKPPSHVDKRTISYQLQKIGRYIVNIFDLDLLRDPIYLNMMLGLSIAIFAEINFSLLTPFILNDMNYNTDQIASVMSALALTDIIFRFLAPYIGEAMKQPPRIMYMISLSLLIISRSFVFVVGTYTGMLIVGIMLGVAKGIRTVYMSLVIPEYIPIDRLASASGIQMVTNGMILMAAGPLLGWIRDVTGSYLRCIIIINMVTLTALCMWTVEMVYLKYRGNKKT